MPIRFLRALPLLAALALPVAVHAQSAAPAPTTQAEHQHKWEDHLSKLHDKLKITTAQDAAWQAFVQTMQDGREAMRQAHEANKDKIASMSALDLMRLRADGAAARAANAQKTLAAFQTLYEQLSPEQKTLADDMARKMAEHRHHDHHGKPGQPDAGAE